MRTGKISIEQLALELRIEPERILEKLAQEGLGDVAPSYQALIQLGLAETIREWFAVGGRSTAAEPLWSPGSTRNSQITAIELGNFKAFGERQRIELRPVTLLFGPNSGGKSSILHAIHYAREVLLRRNADVFRCESGGDTLDLGGLGSVMHRPHETAAEMSIQFDLRVLTLPHYVPLDEFNESAYDAVDDLTGRVERASVRLVLGWFGSRPALLRYEVGINGAPLAIVALTGGPHLVCRDINWLHPLFDPDDDELAEERRRLIKQISELERVAAGAGKDDIVRKLTELREQASVTGRMAEMYEAAGGVPRLGETILLRVLGRGDEPNTFALPPWYVPLHVAFTGEPEETAIAPQEAFTELLTQLVLGPVDVLRQELEALRYVGPLRIIPPRRLDHADLLSGSRWASGLAAWEMLLDPNNDVLLNSVSEWLWQERRLDTGYRAVQASFREVTDLLAQRMLQAEEVMADEDSWTPAFREVMREYRSLALQPRLVLEEVGSGARLQPQDVGVGISQVLPVLVGALAPGVSVVALEQPELHLHPRQQAPLGDLFIEAALAGAGQTFIVETHSEHLLLRILRRIRQGYEETLPKGAFAPRPEQLGVFYVRRGESGSIVRELRVSDEGEFVDDWPDGFFDERGKELFE